MTNILYRLLFFQATGHHFASDDGFYRCLFKLEGAPDGFDEMTGAGVDSYMALLCAIKFLHGHVKVFNGESYMQGRLRWADDSETDLGFSISTGN